MFSTSMAFAAALTLQTAVQTPPATTEPSPQVAAEDRTATPPRARRVCERRALTGRRLEQTICYTPEQYAALVEAKRKELREIQSRDAVQYDRSIVGIPPGPL